MLLGKLAEKQQIGTFLKAEVAVLGKSGNQIFDIVTTIEELAVCGNRFTIDNFCGTDFRDLRQSDQDTFSVQIAQLSGSGIINEILMNLHVITQPINFFAHPNYFWPIVAFANVWKETGWNAIIYLAAITSIDPSLYEAASIDGAGRWAKIKYVTLPGIKPTIMILLLMNVGNVLNAGFEIQYLLGNGLVQKVSQTIDIYVLKWGISQGDYSIGTAAGIFKSAVSIILIVIANQIAKRNGEERLF